MYYYSRSIVLITEMHQSTLESLKPTLNVVETMVVSTSVVVRRGLQEGRGRSKPQSMAIGKMPPATPGRVCIRAACGMSQRMPKHHVSDTTKSS